HHARIGANLERSHHHRCAGRGRDPDRVLLQPDLELFQGQARRAQPMARYNTRVADPRNAAEARQLRQRAARGVSLGLRLQRSGCRRGLHPAEPAAGAESRWRGAQACRRLNVTTSLLVLAVIMAIIVGWLLRQTLNVKPWASQGAVEGVDGKGALHLPTIKVGLWVFLGVATSLFALLISAYHMRMMDADWTKLPVPKVLWLNTAVLVLSSAAMQWARNEAERAQEEGVK